MRLRAVFLAVLLVAFAAGSVRAAESRSSTDDGTLNVRLYSPKLAHPTGVDCALLLSDSKKPVTFNFALVNTAGVRLKGVQLEFATSRGSSILSTTPRPQGFSHRSAIWTFRGLPARGRKSISLTAKYPGVSNQQTGQFEILATGHRSRRQGPITSTHLQCAVGLSTTAP